MKMTKRPCCLLLACSNVCEEEEAFLMCALRSPGVWHASIIEQQSTICGCSLGHVAVRKKANDSATWQIQNVASTRVIFPIRAKKSDFASGI